LTASEDQHKLAILEGAAYCLYIQFGAETKGIWYFISLQCSVFTSQYGRQPSV